MEINKEREEFEKEAFKQSGGWATFQKAYGDVYENNQLNFAWKVWLAAKKQAIPEGVVLVPKLSANYLFNQVPELGFKHQDEKDTVLYHLNYMASEFKESAKEFVKKDHEKQIKFIEEEAQEQSHD